MDKYTEELQSGERFAFGKNWARFLSSVTDQHIVEAQRSLSEMLGTRSLVGKRFLDIGCGSGLFSLAARRLGATVYSFDYDPTSVSCTRQLRDRYDRESGEWVVEQGSILDITYLRKLEKFDVIYSWGVLHHTGDMWKALENISNLATPGSVLFIAIYNDQGHASQRWLKIKRLYNRLPHWLQGAILLPVFIRLWGPTMARDLLSGHPLKAWKAYGLGDRGMSPWRDVVDWIGGYPFEVAKPEEIFSFYRNKGFVLQRLKTCGGGIGCNEFVLQRMKVEQP